MIILYTNNIKSKKIKMNDKTIYNSVQKWNAKISYLLLFLVAWFFINKTNPNVNNDFVRSHSKIALVLHVFLLLNYVIFILYWDWIWINFQVFLNYTLNEIIAIIIFLFLFLLMLIWISKANKWEIFSLSKTIKFWNISLDNIYNNISTNKDEEYKLAVLMSRIPLIWFILTERYKDDIVVKNSNKLNFIISFLIIYVFIYINTDLASLLFLSYIIFIIFLIILLLNNNRIIYYNLDFISNIRSIYIYVNTSILYIYNYYIKSNFIKFDKIKSDFISKLESEDLVIMQDLLKNKDYTLSKAIIYIPILNLINLFFINTKYKIHIINTIIISILYIISCLLFWSYNNYQIFLVFLLVYWAGNISNLWFRMYFIYDIYSFLKFIYIKIINLFIFIKKKKNEEKIFIWKVWMKN